MNKRKYVVCYTSTADDDCCSVWCYAWNEEDAIMEVKCEYWDVGEIIYVKEI